MHLCPEVNMHKILKYFRYSSSILNLTSRRLLTPKKYTFHRLPAETVMQFLGTDTTNRQDHLTMELLKCEVTNAGTAQDMMPPPSSGVLPLHSRNTTQTWRPQLKTASVTGSNSMKRKPRTVTWCVLERKTSTPRVLSQTQAKHQSHSRKQQDYVFPVLQPLFPVSSYLNLQLQNH